MKQLSHLNVPKARISLDLNQKPVQQYILESESDSEEGILEKRKFYIEKPFLQPYSANIQHKYFGQYSVPPFPIPLNARDIQLMYQWNRFIHKKRKQLYEKEVYQHKIGYQQIQQFMEMFKINKDKQQFKRLVLLMYKLEVINSDQMYKLFE